MHWDENSARLQEKMAEYAYAVWSKFTGKIGFLNFLIKMTKDCDCMSKDQPVIVGDVGIAASLDPVALDKASADLAGEGGGKRCPPRGLRPRLVTPAQARREDRLGFAGL